MSLQGKVLRYPCLNTATTVVADLDNIKAAKSSKMVSVFVQVAKAVFRF